MTEPQTPEAMTKEPSAFKADYEKNDYYILSSNFHGTTRLALQNYIWREALGFSIHPRIAPHLPVGANIADVAAGTALWLRDVSNELGARASALDALDINLNQAPPAQWLPDNLSLHEWNIFDEPPAQFHGKYDLVHVRLITVVIKGNDPAAIIRRFAKLLSGWLQWDEIDISNSFVLKATPDLAVPHMDDWRAWMANPKHEKPVPAVTQWQRGAVDALLANGFTGALRHDHAAEFTRPCNLALMRYNSDQLLMLSEQFARGVYAEGNAMGPRLMALVDAAARDAEKGAAMVMPPVIWTAQKAV